MSKNRSLALNLLLLFVFTLGASNPVLARHHIRRGDQQPSAGAASSKHSRRHNKVHGRRVAAGTARKLRKNNRVAGKHSSHRYAYAVDRFMWSAPEQFENRLSEAMAVTARDCFERGQASKFNPSQLIDAGVFSENPLRGGIFGRREPVKYIILHSTETGRAADAPRVIKSWNRGMRHPGAQFIVDRDGTIYNTVDPQFATVHVDVFRTLYGINNDNSVGIEIVRSGSQLYTQPQLDSVEHLVAYLQGRFAVADDHIYGHGQIQPSDRTDPVNFDWVGFRTALTGIHNQTVAFKKRTQSAVMFSTPQSPPRYAHMIDFIHAQCGVVQ